MSLAAAPVLPARYQVVERQEETHDTVTLRLRPVDQPIPAYRPGQFTMMYAPGIGEVPISISGMGPGLALVQTVRAACESDAGLGYELLQRVMAAASSRLQATRVRMLDLYGASSAVRGGP